MCVLVMFKKAKEERCPHLKGMALVIRSVLLDWWQLRDFVYF